MATAHGPGPLPLLLLWAMMHAVRVHEGKEAHDWAPEACCAPGRFRRRPVQVDSLQCIPPSGLRTGSLLTHRISGCKMKADRYVENNSGGEWGAKTRRRKWQRTNHI